VPIFATMTSLAHFALVPAPPQAGELDARPRRMAVTV